LELANAAHIPVARGCDLPLVQPSLLAPETHGLTGLGYAKVSAPRAQPIALHAIDFLIEQILKSPGEITLVAIGPLTNVALAIRQEPRVVEALKELIIMGYHAGIPTTLVPLDVTYQCILTPGDVSRLLQTDAPITQFVADATRFYMEFHDEYQKIEGCVINDPLALALTFAPELCTYQDLPVDVDLSGGISMGKTVGDFYNYGKRPANMRVALGVRARDFMDLFVERIERLARSPKL
jgi:purine nucleosidase